MVRKLTIDLPEDVFARLEADAAAAGTSPEAVMVRLAVRRYTGRPEATGPDPLVKYFGSISTGDPNSADNERIDADLAREYMAEGR
ncbi:MAG: hypothetical protein U0871_12960 [Gemmataceae bacterium]